MCVCVCVCACVLVCLCVCIGGRGLEVYSSLKKLENTSLYIHVG